LADDRRLPKKATELQPEGDEKPQLTKENDVAALGLKAADFTRFRNKNCHGRRGVADRPLKELWPSHMKEGQLWKALIGWIPLELFYYRH